MREIFYATGNQGKFDDVAQFVERANPQIKLVQFAEDLPELQSADQRFVAIQKGYEAWRRLKKPVIIDDAGIYFNRYRDFPGVFTKYIYKGIGFEGIQRLISNGDTVYYQLHLVYFYGDNNYQVFVGRVDGTIKFPEVFPQNPSLPFDTMFVPMGETRTFAELRTSGGRESFDHRIAAFKDFLAWLRV